MAQEKTPGVYVNELDAFPSSVVEVPTAVPAFIGYTQKAARRDQDLTGIPTRITSFADYQSLFGGPPRTMFRFSKTNGQYEIAAIENSRFLLYAGMRLFFNNGGSSCWMVSVGGYGDADNPTVKSPRDFNDTWDELTAEPEASMIVTPDAVLLDRSGHAEVANGAIDHCTKMQSRIAILDIHDGFKARDFGDDDVISGTRGFRTLVNPGQSSFGVAYCPWLNTSIYGPSDVDFTRFDQDGRSALSDHLKAGLPEGADPDLVDLLEEMKGDTLDPARARHIDKVLQSLAPYNEVMTGILTALNVQPPSAAMAGVIARTDNERGAWNAPANTGIVSVVSPTVEISAEEQQDLNVPLNGKAINAIRSFMGRGILVWGARTMDGNSQDWRYVNVRRTMIMLEQSIRLATQAFVFESNDARTWSILRTMIANFLNNQWKAGALAGASPQEAYQVSVGLGSTMTGQDILDSYMRVTVKVAISRPAEFIVITFQQKMQAS